jgi:hypothetical protein
MRKAWFTAVAALIAMSGGSVACAGSPGPHAASGIADTTLLAPEDLGEPGWRYDHAAPGADPPWAFAMHQCVRYDDADYPAQHHREGTQVRVLTQHPGHARRVEQRVDRFAPGWSARSIADVHRVVERCGHYEYGERSPGAPGFLESVGIVDSGFAGEESLLVVIERLAIPGESTTTYVAVVRQADLLVTLVATGVGEDRVRLLARRAAALLR